MNCCEDTLYKQPVATNSPFICDPERQLYQTGRVTEAETVWEFILDGGRWGERVSLKGIRKLVRYLKAS